VINQEQQRISKANKRPINQIAKRFLIKAKVKPEHSIPHLFQLAEWGLKGSNITIEDVSNPRATSILIEELERMIYLEDPILALDQLVKEDGPDQGIAWVMPRELMQQEDPLEAAAYLVEGIWGLLIWRGIL